MGSGVSGINATANLMQNATAAYDEASKSYTVSYTPFARGQISKTDAGQVYKAAKNNNIDVPKEFISYLYDETKRDWRGAGQRYSGMGYLFYDRIYNATHALLNNDFSTAQKALNAAIDYHKRNEKG